MNRGLGSGVYALSAQGRERFAEFPDVLADDFYVYCLVGGENRVSPSDAYSIVDQPRTLSDLAKRRLRIEKGNAELRRQGLTASAGGAGLVDVVRKEPRLLPNAALYAGLHAWARQRVSRMSVTEVGWQRAESSRLNVNGGEQL